MSHELENNSIYAGSVGKIRPDIFMITDALD